MARRRPHKPGQRGGAMRSVQLHQGTQRLDSTNRSRKTAPLRNPHPHRTPLPINIPTHARNAVERRPARYDGTLFRGRVSQAPPTGTPGRLGKHAHRTELRRRLISERNCGLRMRTAFWTRPIRRIVGSSYGQQEQSRPHLVPHARFRCKPDSGWRTCHRA
ncbi:hypothetical protein NFJ07_14580 [Arthrobacter sp. B2a2-09]|nr:hypothetical protein [Arthrobacter sp. B2a2-09]MCZ9883009.1 hypothetical protein [Arthrobacter sp. B2a2-09]